MAYRTPMFGFAHAALAVGSSAITPTAGSSSLGEGRLVDDLPGRLYELDAAQSNAGLDVDLGASPETGIDRLVIPPGHDVGNLLLTVEEDDNAGFASPTQLGSTAVPAGSAVIDLALTASSERYLRARTNTSNVLSMGELIYTKTVTPAFGPEPGWDHVPTPNLTLQRFDSGAEHVVVLGSVQDVIRLELRALDGSSFTAIMDGLALVGYTARPFLFWPPDDRFGPLWVRQIAPVERRQDSPSPQGTGPSYTLGLTMRQVV